MLVIEFEPKERTLSSAHQVQWAEKGPLPFLICFACCSWNPTCYPMLIPLPLFSSLVTVLVSTVMGASVLGSLPFSFCVLWQEALYLFLYLLIILP